MKKRMIHMGHLRPELLELYKEFHRNVWPELEASYRQAGITQVSCFISGTQLLVYSEYDDTRYPATQVSAAALEVQEKWSKLMRPLADPDIPSIQFEEVYHMPEAVPSGVHMTGATERPSASEAAR